MTAKMFVNKGNDFSGVILYGCKGSIAFCMTVKYWQNYMVIILKRFCCFFIIPP